MGDPLDRFVRAVAGRDSYTLVWAQFSIAHLVMLSGMGLLSLYQHMSSAQFWLLVGISQALVLIDNLISIRLTRSMWTPVRAWEQGARAARDTVHAWTALATLPLEYVRRIGPYPLLFSYLPFIAFTTWELGLRWTSFITLSLVGTSVVACNLIIRYFSIEVVCRPVLEQVAADLPIDFHISAPSLPLRWRLFAAAPVINVVTAIVVAGLSSHGGHASISDLGLSWLIAVGVTFTISLVLVILSVRSVGSALRDLQRATDRVRAGDYTARVPVVATDETGKLAQSFNTMLLGLDERERLREAFGAYVDPGLAERVLREGSDLEGEEVEVSILFLDIREFTAFCERSRPREVVALLNGLWEVIVPVLLRHGGHANKFLGDGLMAVFGAPERLGDHATRAVTAALEIIATVAEHYQREVGVGIGINSGRVVAGTVGGGGRVEFSVVGDAVNTASRVEAATRETGDDVLITEATRERLDGTSLRFRERPPVPLKGKREHVRLWAPVLPAPGGAEPGADAGRDVAPVSD